MCELWSLGSVCNRRCAGLENSATEKTASSNSGGRFVCLSVVLGSLYNYPMPRRQPFFPWVAGDPSLWVWDTEDQYTGLNNYQSCFG